MEGNWEYNLILDLFNVSFVCHAHVAPLENSSGYASTWLTKKHSEIADLPPRQGVDVTGCFMLELEKLHRA